MKCYFLMITYPGSGSQVLMHLDSFASTNLGKVVTAIVVYKLIGMAIIKFTVGLGILLFGGAIITYLIFTRFGSVQYEIKPYLFGLWNRKVVVESNESSDDIWARLWAIAAMIVITLTTGLNVMF